MRIVVDMERCIGSGMCTTLAPEQFELDDAGELHVRSAAVPVDMEAAVREAVVCCPVGALAVESR